MKLHLVKWALNCLSNRNPSPLTQNLIDKTKESTHELNFKYWLFPFQKSSSLLYKSHFCSKWLRSSQIFPFLFKTKSIYKREEKRLTSPLQYMHIVLVFSIKLVSCSLYRKVAFGKVIILWTRYIMVAKEYWKHFKLFTRLKGWNGTLNTSNFIIWAIFWWQSGIDLSKCLKLTISRRSLFD